MWAKDRLREPALRFFAVGRSLVLLTRIPGFRAIRRYGHQQRAAPAPGLIKPDGPGQRRDELVRRVWSARDHDWIWPWPDRENPCLDVSPMLWQRRMKQWSRLNRSVRELEFWVWSVSSGAMSTRPHFQAVDLECAAHHRCTKAWSRSSHLVRVHTRLEAYGSSKEPGVEQLKLRHVA